MMSSSLSTGLSAATMEIISRKHPKILEDVLPQVIELAATDRVPQVRWHIAEIMGNVRVPDNDLDQTVGILIEYLEDKSKIVKYCAVQALGILGCRSSLKNEIIIKIGEQKEMSKSLSKIVTQVLADLDTNRKDGK